MDIAQITPSHKVPRLEVHTDTAVRRWKAAMRRNVHVRFGGRPLEKCSFPSNSLAVDPTFYARRNTESRSQSTVPDYAALEMNSGDGKQAWIRLHQESGIVHLISYEVLYQAIYLPYHLHDDGQSESILLQTHSDTIHIQGRNLLPAIMLLQSRELTAIYATQTDRLPASEDRWPIVTRMTLQREEEEQTTA